MSASTETIARVQQLDSLSRDLRCWEARDWVIVDGWTVDGAPLAPGTVWARARQLHHLECAAVTIPDDWPADADARLELGAYGYGSLRITGSDGRVAVHPVNEYHRRYRLGRGTSTVRATLAPIRDRRVGIATIGDRWRTRVVRLEPDVDAFCRTLTAICDLARTGDESAVAALALAEAAVAAIRWPSRSGDFVSRVSHLENHRRHWFDVPVDAHPAPLTDGQRDALRSALEQLRAGLRDLRAGRDPAGAVDLIGYAHTDLEWLWPEQISHPAVVGQFAGALDQLSRFPEYRFGQSGSYLYQVLEEQEPQAFADLTAAVDSGRWELLTGMWVEPDANMLTGESLTRQLVHGQAYYRSRFGRRSEVCWLPDTFGFTGALPQLLAGAGLRYFFTTRLSTTQVRPHHGSLFRWEGIDGSSVLAFAAASTGGYQCVPSVTSLRDAWTAYPDHGLHPRTLQPLGYANGIGPTDGDLADARVVADLPGVPETRFTTAADFFADADRRTRFAGLPVWRGELYMEGFRGTLTTQGRTKVMHRRAESALLAAETLTALHTVRTGRPPESLTEPWQRLLTRQTHDIISGTCVGEIHAAAEKDFADITAAADQVTGRALAAIAADLPVVDSRPCLLLANPTLSPRRIRAVLPPGCSSTQQVDGGSLLVADGHVPPLGVAWSSAWTTTDRATADSIDRGVVLDNRLVRVIVDPSGAVSSVYDKRQRREVIAGAGNVLQAYLDRPHHWDAWELPANYHRFPLEAPTCQGIEVVEQGPARAAVRVRRTFRDSRITQDIRLWADSSRIDFATRIDWHERRVLLRTTFPTTVRADFVTCECAYGVVRRPTATDTDFARSRFEFAAHRFVDLSDRDGGVALLNNGRYGHHAENATLGLSLLRSPVFPDPFADEGHHTFTYSLYPHPGDWLGGGVTAEAADLNQPLPVIDTIGAGTGVWQPIAIAGLPLELGALKAAEHADGLVLRAYEPAGRRGAVTVTPPPGWTTGNELNLLEDTVGPPRFTFEPHQIRTWSIDRVGHCIPQEER
jgi:alpha-mannosidase